jgi:arsenite-transporting ATPase
MESTKPSFLVNKALLLLLFSGKGGVGKTTLAASSASHWTSQNARRKVLIISTDPAHSLCDCFEQPIGDKITPIANVPNLFAQEMDAARRLEDFKQQYGTVLKSIVDRGTYFDQEDIAEFFDISLPGLDELMAVIEIADIIRENEYNLVILDTLKTNLNRMKAILGDPIATEFVPITIPQAMSIVETVSLIDNLKALSIRVETVVVNRVILPGKCEFCEVRIAGQEIHLMEIQNQFSDWNLLRLPLMPHQVHGLEALRRMVRVMMGEITTYISPISIITQPRALGEDRRYDVGSLAPHRLLLFGGKGGVGKTTIAAATALSLASKIDGHTSKTTSIFSTDPAHSLSDSLNQNIGNRITPVEGVPRLFAMETNSTDLLEELNQAYVAEINEVVDAFLPRSYHIEFDRQVMEELITLPPPSLDELMALLKIMGFIEAGQFDRYVLDLAPAGHALRFLETPGIVRKWFVTFFKLLLKYQGFAPLTNATELLRQKSKQLRKVQQLLSDAEKCQFIALTIPEAMAVLEMKRLLKRLAELSVPCRFMITHMVAPVNECPVCSMVRVEQQPYLEEIDAILPGFIQMPLFPQEVQGLAGLTQVAEFLFGGRNG